MQPVAATEAPLPVSHFANPMLAGALAAQGQPQQPGSGATLLPLAAGAGALPAAAAAPHPNPSAAPACPAVFVANIGHIGTDRDLKDLFNRFAMHIGGVTIRFSAPSAHTRMFSWWLVGAQEPKVKCYAFEKLMPKQL